MAEALRLAGRPVADAVLAEVAAGAAAMTPPPALVFVRVGEDPASASYVRSKERSALKVGIDARTIPLPESTQQPELAATLRSLAADGTVDGILLQLPLPRGLDADAAVALIPAAKDVDGLGLANVGRLWSGMEGLFPCTALGLIRILDHYGLEIEGREVVIVGRSMLVGKPAAALFLARNATVTVAHSRTRDLAAVTRRADILVAAVGVPALIGPDMVKPGAVVLDVGLTRVEGAIVGDVAPAVAQTASALTPMPGGTGLMTVAMLLDNTLRAARARRNS